MRGRGHLEAIEHGRSLGRPDLVTIRCLVTKKLPWLRLLPQLTHYRVSPAGGARIYLYDPATREAIVASPYLELVDVPRLLGHGSAA